MNLTTEVALVRVLLPGPAADMAAKSKGSDLHSIALQLMQVSWDQHLEMCFAQASSHASGGIACIVCPLSHAD